MNNQQLFTIAQKDFFWMGNDLPLELGNFASYQLPLPYFQVNDVSEY
jgi:hypothetical protein